MLRAIVVVAALLVAPCACTQAGSRAIPSAGSAGVRRAVVPARSKEKVLYSFTGYNDGGDPATDLIADGSGTLYGTTVIGGQYGCGTVFALTPSKKSRWEESALYSFDCYGHGKNPYGGVTFDGRGHLDGTTVSGGGSCNGYGCGIVFQLAGSAQTVLLDFDGSDGSGPGSGLATDKRGNLYGTTPDGGPYSVGVVYRLAHPHGEWQETVIHAFTGGTDGGVGSLGRLLVDRSGDLYGVAEEGGAGRKGTVFELSPHKEQWQLTTLYAFTGAPDAASPYGGLVADASGDLFGTTYYGGSSDAGTVFELARNGKHLYSERVLYSFKGGNDGSNPTSTPVFGSSGQLYGTTSNGGGSCGSYGCGVVFSLDPHSKKERVLHSFGGRNDGQHPYYGLLQGKSGVLYGTTAAGGRADQGVVFAIHP